MAVRRNTGRVVEVGVLHAQAFGFFVHLFDEFVDRAVAQSFGKGNGGIVGRLDGCTLNQGADTDRNFGIEEHTRTFDFPCSIGNRQHLSCLKRTVFQCFKGKVGGHHLRQCSRLDRGIGIVGCQGLFAVQVGNDIGSRRNFRRRCRAVDAVQQRLRLSLALYGRCGCNRVGSEGRSIQEGSKD